MSMKAAPLGPFTIHSDQAQAWEFGSFSDAAHFIRRNRLEMSEHPLPGREEGVWKGYFGTRYILRDECGLIVPTWRIAREIEALEPVPLPRWYVRRHGNYDPDRDFRNGPVPGDGNGRWGGRFLRHMKTRQELRELKGLEADMRDLEDFPVRVKIRGRRKTLPTLWDDVPFAERGDGWKNYRRTQYKRR